MKTFIRSVLAMLVASVALGDDPPAARESKTDDAARSAPPSAPSTSGAKGTVTAETARSPLDFTMKNIDGQDVPLSTYRGNVLLVVNVASRCGLTKRNYAELEPLYQKYKDRGLRVLAFPANDFLGQEPGTSAEIKNFCQTEYGVTFDLFDKISVKGAAQHEFYKYLTTKTGEFSGDIEWNFAKFLIGRDGRVIGRFGPRTNPSDAKLTEAIEKALDAPAPTGNGKPAEATPAAPAEKPAGPPTGKP